MRKALMVMSCAAGLSVSCVCGYILGKQAQDRDVAEVLEKGAVEKLAGQLFMLEQIEMGDVTSVRRLLQAGTSGELETIMVNGRRDADPAYAKFRCDLLSRLKNYREKNSLFTTPDWEY